MPNARWDSALRQLKRLFDRPDAGTLTDRQLLEQFVHERDEAAFALLVERHGLLVKGVCWRVLRQTQDVEDVFQATFLVLARKAAVLRWQTSVGSWLHAVAYRLARGVQRAAQRRQAVLAASGAGPRADASAEAAWRDLCAALDEEVRRLPEKCRLPVVLCYLEGQTRDRAAGQLGWSLRTLDRRLEEGRELLRVRLEQRGVVLSATLLLTDLAASGPAVSATLVRATARAGASSRPARRANQESYRQKPPFWRKERFKPCFRRR